ncbi:hypothetical protein DNTS_025176 [Danionella cerebrum]|uniref:Rab-GAP TBC domain-containing protein n=1 Tax=Danionella cerebrum TaxID=2873325 RepID=A0A553QC90_9TELE|nr:hypothetical protein DNTS_025176 [Danionella translucida]
MDDRPSLWARDYVESLHQNSRATLLFGKNNVLVQPTDDLEAIPGYLSLHQTAELMTLKWTPNQLMNGNTGELDYEKSVYWDYAMTIRFEEIVYLHCHQQVDSGGTVVLVSQDGIQRPPFRFPKGGHLLQFLTCLETGLLPHGQLDPPLWSQRGKGKVFPKLRKRSPHGSCESFSDKDEDEATDYVFRILYPGSQEFGMVIGIPVRVFLRAAVSVNRAPLKLLCETMKHQIISRAFYGWLAYCRHLSTVRTHLSALVNPTIVEPDIPYDAKGGLSAEVWKTFLQDSSALEEEDLLRLVYYGGVDPALRKDVDEQIRACYEQTMSEWLGCEAIVRQREKEQHAAALAKCASGTSDDRGSRQDSTISTDSSQFSSSEKQNHAGSHSDSTSSAQVFGSVDEVDPIESEIKPKDEKPQPKIPNGTLPNCTSSPDSGHPSSRNFSVTSALSDCSPSTEETSTQESGLKNTTHYSMTIEQTDSKEKSKEELTKNIDMLEEVKVCSDDNLENIPESDKLQNSEISRTQTDTEGNSVLITGIDLSECEENQGAERQNIETGARKSEDLEKRCRLDSSKDLVQEIIEPSELKQANDAASPEISKLMPEEQPSSPILDLKSPAEPEIASIENETKDESLNDQVTGFKVVERDSESKMEKEKELKENETENSSTSLTYKNIHLKDIETDGTYKIEREKMMGEIEVDQATDSKKIEGDSKPKLELEKENPTESNSKPSTNEETALNERDSELNIEQETKSNEVEQDLNAKAEQGTDLKEKKSDHETDLKEIERDSKSKLDLQTVMKENETKSNSKPSTNEETALKLNESDSESNIEQETKSNEVEQDLNAKAEQGTDLKEIERDSKLKLELQTVMEATETKSNSKSSTDKEMYEVEQDLNAKVEQVTELKENESDLCDSNAKTSNDEGTRLKDVGRDSKSKMEIEKTMKENETKSNSESSTFKEPTLKGIKRDLESKIKERTELNEIREYLNAEKEQITGLNENVTGTNLEALDGKVTALTEIDRDSNIEQETELKENETHSDSKLLIDQETTLNEIERDSEAKTERGVELNQLKSTVESKETDCVLQEKSLKGTQDKMSQVVDKTVEKLVDSNSNADQEQVWTKHEIESADSLSAFLSYSDPLKPQQQTTTDPETPNSDSNQIRSILRQITESESESCGPITSFSKPSPDLSDDSPSALEMEEIASSVVFMSPDSTMLQTPLILARPTAPCGQKVPIEMPALELCMEAAPNTSPEGTDSALSEEEEQEMGNLFPKPDSLAVTGDRNDIASPVSSIGTTYSQELVDLYTLNLHRIDKDVHRCDRSYWYFTPENLEKLRNIMCSYVWQHLDIGYMQGMCDLLAPLLVILDDEAMAFSCFTELMKRMNQNFPHGGAMDRHFANMRSLIQILDSELFELMQQNGDYTHFYFCYRWFLLDFKREMVYDDVFSVWETIWAARYASSEHFVLFIALALVELYRDIILENNMDFTDIIKFFNEMAERHDVPKMLVMARDLVHKVQILIENK